MRIAHLANFHGPRSGGLRTTMRALATEYRRAGHTVLHVVPGPRTERTVVDGAQVQFIASPLIPRSGGYRIIVNVAAVRRALADFEPDVVEISDRLTMLLLTRWVRAHGATSSMFAHERIDGVLRAVAPRLPMAQRIADAMNRWAAARVDHVIATTRFAAAEFDRLSLPTHLVPLGLDTDFFSPMLRTQTDAADAWRPLRLVLCSRLSYEKRCDIAIDVVTEALHNGWDVQLDIVGDGPLRADLERRASSLPITFHGFITDRARVAAMLADADVLLAPGPIETFGLAALEALGCGTPVVANRASAIPEVIGHAGRSAGDDANEWLMAIAELIALGPEARIAARQLAEHYSWSATAARLQDIYAHSISGAPCASLT